MQGCRKGPWCRCAKWRRPEKPDCGHGQCWPAPTRPTTRRYVDKLRNSSGICQLQESWFRHLVHLCNLRGSFSMPIHTVVRHLQIGNLFLSFRCSQNIRGKKTWRRCWWLWTGTLETDLMMVELGRLQRRQVEDSTRSSSLIQAFEYVRTAAMSTKKKQLQHTSWCAEPNPVFQYHYREREMKIIFQTTSSMSRQVRDVPYYYRETKLKLIFQKRKIQLIN